MQKIDGKQITIILTNDQLETLNRLAEKYGVPRATVIRTMMELGFTAYADLERIGAMKIGDAVTAFEKKLMSYRQPKLI